MMSTAAWRETDSIARRKKSVDEYDSGTVDSGQMITDAPERIAVSVMSIIRWKIAERLAESQRISCEMFGCSSAAVYVGPTRGRGISFDATIPVDHQTKQRIVTGATTATSRMPKPRTSCQGDAYTTLGR